jgi:hypothetical protein
MKLKYTEFQEVYNCLNTLAQTKSTTLWFIIASNLNKMKADAERIYKDLAEVAKKYAVLENGEPKISRGTYVFETIEKETEFLKFKKENFDTLEVEISFNTKEITDTVLAEDLVPALIAPLLGKILIEKQN